MACENCEIINKKSLLLYEDDIGTVSLKQNCAAPGHIIVAPKKHYTILEQVPDEELIHLFILANKAAILLFEGIDAAGTNIIIQNGVSAGQKIPHFSINIIPRSENDSLNFQWPIKKLTEDEMETAEVQLKEALEAKKEKLVEEKKAEIKTEEKKSEEIDEDNYMLKHLNRIP